MMNEKKRRSLQFGLAVGLGLILVTAGLLLGSWTLKEARRTALESQDSQLMKAAQSVDNDIIGHFRWYCSDLAYVTTRRGFLNAEETWLESEDEGELLRHLRDNPLSRVGDIEVLTAARNGAVELSTDGNLSYTFSDPIGTSEDGTWVALCRNGAGKLYIALCLGRGEVTYAALIDGEAFFATTEQQSAVGEGDRVILLDATGTLFCHRPGRELHLDRVAECCMEESVGLEQLRAAQETGESDTVFFEAEDRHSGETYTARLAVLPAGMNNNGCFTVGVLSDYDATARELRTGLLRAIASFTFIAVGVMLFVLCIANVRQYNVQAEKELAVLREKRDAMEELNRQTQELAHHQRLETIGTLTSSIAHEFNNLLTPIMGYSILALEHTPEENTEVYDSLLEIYGASRKAKTIISRLSDLSRKNSPEARQDLSPDELARRLLEVAQPVKPCGVEVAADLNCPRLLHGNETQLSQLLLNLVLNSFRAMEGEGGTVTVSTREEGENVVLRVADTGPGIPPEVLPHIFEPFFTTREGGKGTGLGLAIVQQVAEDHGGTVQVETQVGKGTTFTVRIPGVTDAGNR